MNRKTVPARDCRPIMARSRRESHHSDGITDQKNLQQTSATKSAISGHRAVVLFADDQLLNL
jgi:hypothetical protein